MRTESGARSSVVGAGSGDRARGLVLLLAALVSLTAGGVWWAAQAPADAGAPAGGGVLLDAGTGNRVVVDPVTGRTVAAGQAGLTPGSRVEAEDRGPWRGVVIWSDRATITPRDGLVRRSSRAENGARHVLRFSCTGPGELLVVVDGARYAGPLTSGCGGAVTTATEMTGAGEPIQVSFSTVNDQPLRVEAQLVEFP
ncbi:hypothetical protein [Micromonospora sp. NPDC126480]|uniref:hypothetical protein n=1 Tax=Micromonospora sp. NPDC126480 TaxID=3155312 RepID=UPI00331DDC5D